MILRVALRLIRTYRATHATTAAGWACSAERSWDGRRVFLGSVQYTILPCWVGLRRFSLGEADEGLGWRWPREI